MKLTAARRFVTLVFALLVAGASVAGAGGSKYYGERVSSIDGGSNYYGE